MYRRTPLTATRKDRYRTLVISAYSPVDGGICSVVSLRLVHKSQRFPGQSWSAAGYIGLENPQIFPMENSAYFHAGAYFVVKAKGMNTEFSFVRRLGCISRCVCSGAKGFS